MLTEAEKKWFRERRHENCETCKTHHLLCDRCSHIHPWNVWAWDRFTLSGLNVETTYNELKEAAEFEARVAVKLVGELQYECVCPSCQYNTHGCRTARMSYNQCRLKHARLAVEAEMG
jgi:hypothetical protein